MVRSGGGQQLPRSPIMGPDEVVGARGFVWYEWSATVQKHQGGAPYPEPHPSATAESP